MNQTELNEILTKHKLWLAGEGGERADLYGADLRGADLYGAGLSGADLNYSAWPLWCGSLKAQIDDRIAIQLLYHLLSAVIHSPEVSKDVKKTLLTDELMELANEFHRVDECGRLGKED